MYMEKHKDFLAFISKPPSVVHSICICDCNNWEQFEELFKQHGGEIKSIGVWSLHFKKSMFASL